jgi:hypothetical protein
LSKPCHEFPLWQIAANVIPTGWISFKGAAKGTEKVRQTIPPIPPLQSGSAKSTDACRQDRKKLARFRGGALEAMPVLREFSKGIKAIKMLRSLHARQTVIALGAMKGKP